MNRLDARFAELKSRGEGALVAFVTAGDPYPGGTAEVVCALAEAGADVIEIGVPFSDPLADGPTIQAASFRALQGGMTPPKVLDAVHEARARGVTVPIVLMGAYNPVLQYGLEKFAQDAVAAGADGAIITDVIPEEADTWKPIADAAGLATIFLLAPTSTPERMAAVGKLAAGFVYCVSMTGITGTKEVVPSELPGLVAAIREHAASTPVCVGFGIKTPEQVAAICAFADGAVVGSSLVQLLDTNRDNPDALTLVKDYIAALKAATR
ncbi:tryptophan synthase subunit alpha [Armatimonas sp.]|uniref:tryptophan synthase subunit alpha n=1 Tax=Armatimonas sp. TaxID=1872638 RepID=UPI0037528898